MNKDAFIHPKTGNLVVYGRMVWPSLFAPAKMRGQGDDKAKYQITVLIPAKSNIDVLKKAAQEKAEERFGKKTGGIRTPFRKAEEKDQFAEMAEEFPIYITARSADKPGVVLPNGKATDDPEQVYSGRWCYVTMQAFAYENSGNKGVSFGLQNVQLLDHDDPLNVGGGRVAAESEFEAVEGVSGDDASSSDDLWK